MIRIILPVKLICFAGLLPLLLSSCTATVPDEKPNIIYIMADDLGPFDLSITGQTNFTTPNIDRIATEGMTFTQMYSGNNVCGPSRGVLMTGKHPGHASIRHNQKAGNTLNPGEKTIASVLKEAGYKTAVIGKWGVGYEPENEAPNKFGFDEAYGYINMWHAHNYYPEYLVRNGQKEYLNNKVHHDLSNNFFPQYTGWAYKRVDYTPDLFAEEALKFIDSQKDPFFLYLPMIIPHGNGEARNFNPDDVFEIPDLGRFADKPWTRHEQGKAAQIELMDRNIGRIMDLLEKKGIADNTVLVFTSDNGGQSGNIFRSTGNFRGEKGGFYEGGIRVPFFVRWTDRVKAGSSSDHISAFWDILATFAEIGGAEIPDDTDGISFLPALLGHEQEAHEYMYWEKASRGTYQQAVRMGDWKALRFVDFDRCQDESYYPDLELFNLSSDISETTDVSSDHPEIVRKIEGIMQKANTPFPGIELPDFTTRRK